MWQGGTGDHSPYADLDRLFEELLRDLMNRLLAGTAQPSNTLRLRFLAAHDLVDSGGNIGTSVLNSAAEGCAFTSAGHRLAPEPSIEEHADFYSVTRPAQGRECNQCSDGDHESQNDETNFPVRPH